MADPLSILSVIEGSLSLILQCGSVAKSLNDLAGKFKQAKLTLLSMAQEVDTIELAWSKIRQWSENCEQNQFDLPFVERLDRSLECGTLVISALQQDLAAYTSNPNGGGFKHRAKLTWNERALRDHQDRISRQAIAMGLLLQAVNLPSDTQRKALLQAQEHRLFESDESALSIVPSRQSSRLSLSTYSSIDSTEILHSRLACEDDLFTARAYKRLIKSLLIKSAGSKPRMSKIENDVYNKLLPENSLQTEERNLNTKVQSQGENLPGRSRSPDVKAKYCTSYSPSSIEVREILEETLNVDEAFNRAARLGCLVDKEGLESIGAKVNNTSTKKRLTPLHQAALGGTAAHYEVAEFLIKAGAKATACSLDGLQPIHLACENVSIDLVRLLLDAGASPHCESHSGLRPLHLASKHPGGADIIKLLTDHGAVLDARSKGSGMRGEQTALQMACYLSKNVRNVQTLLDLGATIEAGWMLGYLPLELAIHNRSFPIIRLLLERGANPNTRNARSETCLLLCAKLFSRSDLGDLFSMIHILLNFGAKPTAIDAMGNNVLHFLAKGVLSQANYIGDLTPTIASVYPFRPIPQWPEWISLIRYLIYRGADPAILNDDGDSPQTLAIRHMNLMYFNILFEHSTEKLSNDHLLHLRRLLIQNTGQLNLNEKVGPRSRLAQMEIVRTRRILELLMEDATDERLLFKASHQSLMSWTSDHLGARDLGIFDIEEV